MKIAKVSHEPDYSDEMMKEKKRENFNLVLVSEDFTSVTCSRDEKPKPDNLQANFKKCSWLASYLLRITSNEELK